MFYSNIESSVNLYFVRKSFSSRRSVLAVFSHSFDPYVVEKSTIFSSILVNVRTRYENIS